MKGSQSAYDCILKTAYDNLTIILKFGMPEQQKPHLKMTLLLSSLGITTKIRNLRSL
jgi:hypothetical protein